MENASTFNVSTAPTTSIEDEEEEKFKEFLSTLPKERNFSRNDFYFYQEFWCPSFAVKPLISFKKHFQARDTDIILASIPKSGTTWLKAVVHLIANRTQYSALNDSPLFTSNPHDVVPFLELNLYLKNQFPDLESIPEPRIFGTHVPYASLPSSIRDSTCRIVYVCRNPLDHFISNWQFALRIPWCKDPPTLEEAFEWYWRGVHPFGPFQNHVLGYWRASLENPDKVLFLKYEDLQGDNIVWTERLAEFLGFPFSVEEEKQGTAKEISKFCSFENMKILEGNKNGNCPLGIPHDSYFRKGEVGDWQNYLTPVMAERMKKLFEERLEGSGLSFNMSCKKDA